MRTIFILFCVSTANARSINVSSSWKNSGNYPLGGCARLIIEETCQINKCSGSARRTDNNSDNSENDQIVEWERCSESKIIEIKALSLNVVKEIQNLPSCMPTTTVGSWNSNDCNSSGRKEVTISNEDAIIDDELQAKLDKIEEWSDKIEINQSHFAGSINKAEIKFGPFKIFQ